jgi:hypothetical protein
MIHMGPYRFVVETVGPGEAELTAAVRAWCAEVDVERTRFSAFALREVERDG